MRRLTVVIPRPTPEHPAWLRRECAAQHKEAAWPAVSVYQGAEDWKEVGDALDLTDDDRKAKEGIENLREQPALYHPCSSNVSCSSCNVDNQSWAKVARISLIPCAFGAICG